MQAFGGTLDDFFALFIFFVCTLQPLRWWGKKEEKNVSWKIALQKERINMVQAKL